MPISSLVPLPPSSVSLSPVSLSPFRCSPVVVPLGLSNLFALPCVARPHRLLYLFETSASHVLSPLTLTSYNGLVRHLRSLAYQRIPQKVCSCDLVANEEADMNVVVKLSESWQEQSRKVNEDVSSALGGMKLAACICVAGGWAGGNAAADDVIANADMMWKQSVWTSMISATISARNLEPGGLVVLTGAVPALGGTPGMIGYGMAKAAVHQLVLSLASKDSGLPDGSSTVAILPMTLDTPMNRKFMPAADTSTWTPLEVVAEYLLQWTSNVDRPVSGSLVQLATVAGKTTIKFSDE